MIDGAIAVNISTRWFSGRAPLKISPAKYWKIASFPLPSDSSSVAPRRRRCSRNSTSAATQPSLSRWIRNSCSRSTGWLPRMACASSSVQRSSASSMRAMRPLATRRANSGGGSAREMTMTVIPSGTSSSPCANAARCAGVVSASWKLSKTTAHGSGNAEKRSRKKLRTKRARSCCGSDVNCGNAAAVLPASCCAAMRR